MTLRFRDGVFTRVMTTPETCANGNAFITIDGAPHLLHIDTGAQKLFALPFGRETAPVEGTPRTIIDFADRDFFQVQQGGHLWHETLMPDGLCHWHVVADARDKIIVAIFDPRLDALRAGQALQFDVTNGVPTLEAAYTTPGSPRVTHPAVVQVRGQ